MDILSRRISRDLLAKVAGGNFEAIKYLENLGEDIIGALSAAIEELQARNPGHTIQDEGVALPQRAALDFVGAGVVVTDASGKTVVTIAGGAGGGNLDDVLAVNALL